MPIHIACFKKSKFIFTAHKRSLGQGNVFTGMCQSFCSQGAGGLCMMSLSVWLTGLGVSVSGPMFLLEGSLSRGSLSGGCLPGRDLPGQRPPPQTETPLDRGPLDRDTLGQRPSITVMSGWYASY